MRSTLALLVVLALAVSACSEDEESDPQGQTPEPSSWEGPGSPEANGDVPVAEFNEFLDQTDPDSQRSPMRLTLEFLKAEDPRASRTELAMSSNVESADSARVVFTEDGIADDSIGATRYTIELTRQAPGAWRLDSAVWSQKCQPQRGHQDFSPAPCV